MINDDRLYEALMDRDPQFEGRFFVAVRTTGIFCRLTCPAKKPKRENTEFFASPAACLQAGYRPCKRCRPMASAAEADPLVKALTEALDQDPRHRWREADIMARGFDPSTVRRAFRRAYGATFLEIARLKRIRAGAEARKAGESTIAAQLEAGFGSSSGFRAAFAKLLGSAPGSLTGQERLKADFIETPVGPMIAIGDEEALWLLEFHDRKSIADQLKVTERDAGTTIGLGATAVTQEAKRQLKAYFEGTRSDFDLPLAHYGTDFYRTVWDELGRIPLGKTRSYKDMAEAIGRPTAMRAVARANASNRIALVIPCHRVIAANGSLAGYAGGVWRKTWLLEHERKLAGITL